MWPLEALKRWASDPLTITGRCCYVIRLRENTNQPKSCPFPITSMATTSSLEALGHLQREALTDLRNCVNETCMSQTAKSFCKCGNVLQLRRCSAYV